MTRILVALYFFLGLGFSRKRTCFNELNIDITTRGFNLLVSFSLKIGDKLSKMKILTSRAW